jgi:3-oxoacyl-[acyl-carrier-protein] synthase II
MRRVVITGIGVLTPAGRGLSDFIASLYASKSGIKKITRFDASRFSSQIAGTIDDFEQPSVISTKELRRLDRVTHLAIATAEAALADAGLLKDGITVDGDKTGIAFGTAVGSVKTREESYENFSRSGQSNVLAVPMGMNHSTSALLSIKFRLRGANFTISTACSSGVTAIGVAFNAIRSGHANRMLAGGAEAPITPSMLNAWCMLRTLSCCNAEPTRAMKPFSANRDGFVLAEGGVLMVLEDLECALKRECKIYGEILGFGISSDACHITCPSVCGEELAMQRALNTAGLEPERVDYIVAHGLATGLNDKVESEAIKRVFGTRRVPISSVKPITGHMIAASGAAAFVAGILSTANGLIPPTMNYEQHDPDCDLDFVVNVPRKAELSIFMSNAFAFGGHNAVLVARRAEEEWNGAHV